MTKTIITCVLLVILCARVRSERNLDAISEPVSFDIKSESYSNGNYNFSEINDKESILDGSLDDNSNDTLTDASLNNIWSKLTSLLKTKLEEIFKIEKESPDLKKDFNKTKILTKAYQIGHKIQPVNDNLPKLSENVTKIQKNQKTKIENINIASEDLLTKIDNINISSEDILTALKKVQENEFQRVIGNQEQNTQRKYDGEEGAPIKIHTSFKVESDIFNRLGIEETIPAIPINDYPFTDNNNVPAIKNNNKESILKTVDKDINISDISTKPTALTTENFSLVNLPKVDDYLEKVINNEPKIHKNIEDNEILHIDFPLNVDYGIEDDNSTDYPIIDYIDLYADTTNEYVDFTEGPETENYTNEVNYSNITGNENYSEITMKLVDENLQNLSSTVSPWIATIFVRANDSNQFTYYCDGAVIANTVILTAARCVNITNVDDLIVILGKKSLQISAEGETVHKVKQIKQHENFTATSENYIANDLAVLYLEDPAVFTNSIQPVSMDCGERTEEEKAVTTAWALTGELETIVFEKKTRGNCAADKEHQFCVSYGDDVPLCPSYGGLYLTKLSQNLTEPSTQTPWCLQGVRSADPTNRGVCFDKTVTYTNLSGYKDWILVAIGK